MVLGAASVADAGAAEVVGAAEDDGAAGDDVSVPEAVVADSAAGVGGVNTVSIM